MGYTAASVSLFRQKALNNLALLPPFSPILNRLTGEMAQESVSFARLGDLIESDTVLAGNVLRVVNSPLYGLRATVNSVRHAVAILGLDKLRNIVLGLSVSRLWSKVRAPAGWSMAQFNRHSVAAAILADLVAVECRVDYAEGAFTAGLLHDVGKLLIAITFPTEFVEIDRGCGGDWRREQAHEFDLLGLHHAELSAAALARWNLPAPITAAVKDHHEPLDGAPLTLAGAVQLADAAVNELGHGYRPAIAPSGDPASTLAAHVPADRVDRLLGEFDRSFQAIRAMF